MHEEISDVPTKDLVCSFQMCLKWGRRDGEGFSASGPQASRTDNTSKFVRDR